MSTPQNPSIANQSASQIHQNSPPVADAPPTPLPAEKQGEGSGVSTFQTAPEPRPPAIVPARSSGYGAGRKQKRESQLKPPPPTPHSLAPTPPVDDGVDPMASQLLIQKRKQVRFSGEMSESKAKQFADDLALRLLPDAMALIAHDLRYGSKKEQDAAVDRVLRMNGFDRKEAQAAQTPTIIINMGKDAGPTPWLKREDDK